MKILIAGPGTGKTFKIKEIISKHGDGTKFLILSFTNATINDLRQDLKSLKVTNENCMTLHSFCRKHSSLKKYHLLNAEEK